MGLEEHKITGYEDSIAALPDKIENNAAWLKAKFDARTDKEIKTKHNGLVDTLVALFDAIYTKAQTDAQINAKVAQIGAGDMAKQVYDTNDNGLVDKAERLATVVRLGSANFDGSNSLTAAEMGVRPDTWVPTPEEVGAEPAFSKNTAFNKNFGSAAGTVCQGSDSRLSNARKASNITMSYNGNLYITYS